MSERAALMTQYEALRSAALGEPLPPMARYGLVLLLRRGMWAWARAQGEVASAPLRLSPATSLPGADDRHGVVQVFATMALSSTDRRV
jgi:hypothetical protein